MILDLLKYIEKPLYRIVVPHGIDDYHEEFFTKIPWAEYRRIKNAQKYLSIPETDLEMQIFRDYVLPKGKYEVRDIQSLPAGIVDSVVKAIMKLSDSSTFPDDEGVIPLDDLTLRVNMQRFVVGSQLDIQMMTTICAVFKGYTFETLGALPFDKIIQLFAAAERHLLNVGALTEPLEFGRLNEDEDQEEAKEEKAIVPETTITEDTELIRQHAAVAKKQDPEPVIEIKREESDFIRELEPIEKVAAASVSDSNPHAEKLRELERKRVAAIEAARESGRAQRSDYVVPKQGSVASNGVNTPVPGIRHSGGFNNSDFKGLVEMTDEEALEFAMADDLLPAGYEIIKKKELNAEKDQKKSLEEEINARIGNKTMTLRGRKLLKEQLRKEGYIE